MDFTPTEVVLLLLASMDPLKVTIVAASLMADAPPDFIRRVAMSATIAGIMTLNYFCLRYSAYVVRAAGPSLFQVLGKLMGVILAALAVELMLKGLVGLELIALPTR